MADMNTTMRVITTGLTALLLAGCSTGGQGAAAPSPTASVSPGIQKLAGVLTSDTRIRLDGVVKEFQDRHCDTVFSRGYTSEGYPECSQVRRELSRYVGQLESRFGYRDSWPLEVDELAGRTKSALTDLSAATRDDRSNHLVKPAIDRLYGTILEWSPYVS